MGLGTDTDLHSYQQGRCSNAQLPFTGTYSMHKFLAQEYIHANILKI